MYFGTIRLVSLSSIINELSETRFVYSQFLLLIYCWLDCIHLYRFKNDKAIKKQMDVSTTVLSSVGRLIQLIDTFMTKNSM